MQAKSCKARESERRHLIQILTKTPVGTLGPREANPKFSRPVGFRRRAASSGPFGGI
jgi:hypothetical protein